MSVSLHLPKQYRNVSVSPPAQTIQKCQCHSTCPNNTGMSASVHLPKQYRNVSVTPPAQTIQKCQCHSTCPNNTGMSASVHLPKQYRNVSVTPPAQTIQECQCQSTCPNNTGMLASVHLPKQYRNVSVTPPAQTIQECQRQSTCPNNTGMSVSLHLPKQHRNVSVTVDKRNRAMRWTPPSQTIPDYQWHCGQEKHSFTLNSTCQNNTILLALLWTRKTWLCAELHLPKQYQTISITVDKRNKALCWTPPAQTIPDYQHCCGQEKHSFVRNSICPNTTGISASLWTRETALCWTPPAQTIPDYQHHCGREKHSFVLNSTCPNNTRLSASLWTRETQLCAELHLPKQYQTISITVDERNTALCWTPPAQTIPDYQHHCGREKHSFVLNSTCPNNTRLSASLWTRETQLCAELHLPKQYQTISITVDERNTALCWTPPAQTIPDYQHHCGREKHSFVLNSTCPNNTRLSASLWTRETQLCAELHLPKQYQTISITVDRRNRALNVMSRSRGVAQCQIQSGADTDSNPWCRKVFFSLSTFSTDDEEDLLRTNIHPCCNSIHAVAGRLSYSIHTAYVCNHMH